MASAPVVTFIICTYNRVQYLNDTLKSIFKCDYSDLHFELLVVDNNSEDQTKEVVQKYKKRNENIVVHYVQEPQQGLSYARNRGIKEAEAEYVVFLDDDINAGETLLTAWASFFQAHPSAAAGGGKIHVQFDDPRPHWMAHFLLPLLGHHDLGDDFKVYPKNKFPFGGNMGFKKSIFDDIGNFNADLGRKGTSLGAQEEKELFQRIRARDKDIFYLPSAFLYHRVNKKRLTVDYIKKQAIGLGRSMRLRFGNSTGKKMSGWLSEVGKLIVSVPLAVAYALSFNISKAKILMQFRWWIWKGYLNNDEH